MAEIDYERVKRHMAKQDKKGLAKVCGYVPKGERQHILDYMKMLRERDAKDA